MYQAAWRLLSCSISLCSPAAALLWKLAEPRWSPEAVQGML